MRPAYPRPFKYVKAGSVGDALRYMEEGYKLLAGGQSLSTLLKLGFTYEGLVDIFELDELRYVRVGERLVIGALVVHNDVAMHRAVVEHAPALAKAAWHIADLQVRNRGTIGGSLAHADPAANYIPVLVALGAEVVVREKDAVKRMTVESYVKGPYETEKGLVVEVSVPRWSRQAVAVFKKRGAAYPSLVVAAAAEDKDGTVAKSRLAVGGLYTRPVAAAGVLDGLSLEELPGLVSRIVSELPEGEPYDDLHMSYEDKKKVLPQLLSKVLKELAESSAWSLPTFDRLTTWRGGGGFTTWINGVEVPVDAEPRKLLVDFLRERGAKEVKRGCDEGRCGACTVLMDGRAVKSCTIFAPQALGHRIETVRALQRGGELHPVQRAFLEEFASQCGYCTHGFIMTVVDYLSVDPEVRDKVLRLSVKNICRCTGYVNIIRAIKKAGKIQKA